MTADESLGPNPAEQPASDTTQPEAHEPGVDEPTGEAPADTQTPPDEQAEQPDEQADQPEAKLTITAQVEDLGPCKKRLYVEVDRKHVDEKLAAALNQMVETATVPGFRRGRAPQALVAKRFRREMGDQVKGELVGAAFEQALTEQDLALLSQPDMKLEDIKLPDDGPLTFEAEIEVRPQFDLPDYSDVEILRPIVSVTDEQVDEAVDSLRDRGARLVPKTDEPAEAGDVLVVDLTLTLADRTIKQEKDLSVRMGPTLRLRDVTLDGFQDAVAGARPGDERVCEGRMSEQYDDADLAGKRVQCTVSVKDVKRVERPELDERTIGDMGFESVEALRDALRERLTAQQQRQSVNACREQVYDHLLKQADWDLPEDLVAREAERLAARRRLDLTMAGVTESQVDEHMDELVASSQQRAVRQLKSYFILDKIAEKEGVTVEPADLDAQIATLASRANESPRRIRARLENQDRLGLVEIQVLEQKTVDRILADATHTDIGFEAYNEQRRAEAEASAGAAPGAEATAPEAPSDPTSE